MVQKPILSRLAFFKTIYYLTAVIFETHIPSFPLSGFIEYFIYHKGNQPSHSIDRLLPDGNVVLIIDLTEDPKPVYDNDSLQVIHTCKHSWFSGLHTRPISIPSGRDSEMFLISFHKGMSYPFVPVPLSELTDQVVDGRQLLGNKIDQLREQLLDSATIAAKFNAATAWLLSHYRHRLTDNPFVSFAVSRILGSPGEVRMKQIADSTGYSHKHLIRIFRDHVGVTLKDLSGIARFQNAVRHVDALSSVNWASVAIECGYYDQSHFISDFKRFSGFTPGQYFAAQKSHPNYVVVG